MIRKQKWSSEPWQVSINVAVSYVSYGYISVCFSGCTSTCLLPYLWKEELRKKNNLGMCQKDGESSPCFPNPHNNVFTYLEQWTQKNGNHIWTSYSLVGILPLNRKESHILLLSALAHCLTFSLFPLAEEGIWKQVLLCMHNKSHLENTILTDHLMLLLWGVRNPRLYIKHFLFVLIFLLGYWAGLTCHY